MGRGVNNSHIIEDMLISRNHCVFEKVDDNWVIIDRVSWCVSLIFYFDSRKLICSRTTWNNFMNESNRSRGNYYKSWQKNFNLRTTYVWSVSLFDVRGEHVIYSWHSECECFVLKLHCKFQFPRLSSLYRSCVLVVICRGLLYPQWRQIYLVSLLFSYRCLDNMQRQSLRFITLFYVLLLQSTRG